MNIEQIAEMIKKAKKSTSQPEVLRLIDAFEGFLDLYTQKDQEDTQSFREGLELSYQKMWQAFEQAASVYGLSASVIKQHISDSKNFTELEWDAIESLKQEVGSWKGAGTASKTKARKGKKNKGLRI